MGSSPLRGVFVGLHRSDAGSGSRVGRVSVPGNLSSADVEKAHRGIHRSLGCPGVGSIRPAVPAVSRTRRVIVASEHERRLDEYERQVGDLQDQLKTLEEEIVVLRRRLQDAPKRVRTLEERLLETKGQLAQAVSQNERLSATLREAREHIAALREEVEKLTMPPSAYGTFLGSNERS